MASIRNRKCIGCGTNFQGMSEGMCPLCERKFSKLKQRVQSMIKSSREQKANDDLLNEIFAKARKVSKLYVPRPNRILR